MKRQFKAGVMAKHEVKRLRAINKELNEYGVTLLDKNIEQRTELRKVKKANTQLENEIEEIRENRDLNEEVYRSIINEQEEEIKELKKRVILFAGALLAMCFVAMWGM
jgi:hypothetical protein